MLISKEMFDIARVAQKEPDERTSIDCVRFETDGLRNEATATNGRCAILVKWPALEETEGAEFYLIPASDCLQIKPGIKRVGKLAAARVSDSDDGFTLFKDFNLIGSVFRSPTTGRPFPKVRTLIEDRVYSENSGPSHSFNISQLNKLLSTIEKVIGPDEIVDLHFDESEGGGTVLVVTHHGTKIIESILMGISS